MLTSRGGLRGQTAPAVCTTATVPLKATLRITSLVYDAAYNDLERRLASMLSLLWASDLIVTADRLMTAGLIDCLTVPMI